MRALRIALILAILGISGLGRCPAAAQVSAPTSIAGKPQAVEPWAGGMWAPQAERLFLMGRFDEATRIVTDKRKNTTDWVDVTVANNLLKRMHMRRIAASPAACGAEAVARVLGAHGRKKSSQDVWAVLGKKPGASLLELQEAARKLGWNAAGVDLTPEQLVDAAKPCVALLKAGHFVTVTAATPEAVRFVDSTGAERRYTRDVFSEIWDGIALVNAGSKVTQLASACLGSDEMRFLLGGYDEGPPRPGEEGNGGSTSQPAASFDGDSPCHGRPTWQVNLANMNLVVQDIDLLYSGYGISTEIVRTYSADSTEDGLFGPKWSWNYGMHLKAASGETRVLYNSEGKAVTYSWSGTNFVPDDGSHTVLTRFPSPPDPAQSYTLYDPHTKRTYTFELSGSIWRLARVQDPLGNALALTYSSTQIRITDSSGKTTVIRLQELLSGKYRASEINDVMGNRTMFEYSPAGDLIASTDVIGARSTYAYDSGHYMTSLFVPSKGTTTFEYTSDFSGKWLSKVTNAQGKSRTYSFSWTRTFTDENTHTSSNVSEESGKVVRTTSTTDPRGGTTTRTYDDTGNPYLPTKITDPLGRPTIFAYDTAGNLTSLTDPLVKTTTYDYDDYNNLTSTTDALGHTTTFTYWDPPMGTLKWVTDHLLNRTEFTYDARGLVTSIRDARGKLTTFAHDASGNLTQVTDALGKNTYYTYDALGNRVSMTDPHGHLTFFQYDALSRLVKSYWPDGSTSARDFGCCSILAETDELGKRTAYDYDALGRLQAVVDPAGGVTAFGYDFAGNRTSITDANGHTTAYQYDTADRLTGILYPDGTGETYGHDLAGQVTSKVDGNNARTVYTYDSAGRLSGVFAPNVSIRYAYDAVGNLKSVRDGIGKTTFAYDGLNRVRQVIDPFGQRIVYTYDEVGNRVWMWTPYTRTTYTYDDLNRQAVVSCPWNTTYFSYDASSLRTAMWDSQKRSVYAYDGRDRLTAMQNMRSNGQVINAYQYTLDPAGNPRAIVESDGSRTFYGYDNLYRLVAETRVGGPAPYSYRYTYDAAGNRLSKTDLGAGQTIPYTYDAGNKMLSAGTATFTYDGNGNTLSKTDASGMTRYYWDARNKLVRADVPAVGTITYSYDGMGQRLRKVGPGGTTKYMFDPLAAIPAVLAASTGGVTTGYLATAGGAPIAEAQGGSSLAYIYNPQGTVVTTMNAAGALGASGCYDAWGNGIGPGALSPRGYEGEYGYWADPDSSLILLGARWYDASTARFQSRDPMKESRDMNLYAYAGASPVSFVDPDGLLRVERVKCQASCVAEAALPYVVGAINPAAGRAVAVALGAKDVAAGAVKAGKACQADGSGAGLQAAGGGLTVVGAATEDSGLGALGTIVSLAACLRQCDADYPENNEVERAYHRLNSGDFLIDYFGSLGP